MAFILGITVGAMAVILTAFIFRRIVLPFLVARIFKSLPVTFPYDLFTARSFQGLVNLGSGWTELWFSVKRAESVLSSLRRRAQFPYRTRGSQSDSPIGVETSDGSKVMPQFIPAKEPFARIAVASAPKSPVRLPAEYGALDGVLVSWPTYYPCRWDQHARLVREIARHAIAVVLVPTDEVARSAAQLVGPLDQASTSGGMKKGVRYLVTPVDDVWVRDFGPTIVRTGDGSLAIIANPYVPDEHPFQKGDNAASYAVAQALGLPMYRLPLVIEGGNLVTDGEGTMVCCDSVLARNPELDAATVSRLIFEYFGCDKTVFIESLAGEITGHADMVLRFVDPMTVIVASAPRAHPWHNSFNAIAARISGLSKNGKSVRVVRMPIARSPISGAFWSYVNATQVNGATIMPCFGLESDEDAAAIYRSVTGGSVIQVNFRDFPVGSVHCQTKELPAGSLNLGKDGVWSPPPTDPVERGASL